MYGQLLEAVLNEDLLTQLAADDSTRAWLTSAFLHGSATRCRRIGGPENLERARAMLIEARS
jgi:hypothetical protein